MAYDTTIEGYFDDTGAGSYSLRLYVRSDQRDGANNRSSYAWELRSVWHSGSPRRYNLDATTFNVTVGGYNFSPSHNIDHRSGDEIVLGSGTTGWIGHDGNGNLNIGISFSASEYPIFGSASAYGTLSADRLPRKPSPPGTPTFSNELPTSLTVSWTASTNNGGAAIDAYLLRYWPNAEGTGPYTDHSTSNNLSRSVTGLTPGQEYRFVVYAHNSSGENSGFSNPSGAAVVRMLAGVRIKVAGVWKMAMPYVKVAGVWKMALPYVKNGGSWKITR